ncbi:MAG: hypothetical protein O7D30_12340 [Rickettsia endosymbiont of Ixodes persulcatus]|nr:hypothetical protein [Rickettsia endosymbiont of Ixodes persulcatus]
MAVFSKDERVKILSDIIEIQSVNEKELDVAHYLQQLFKKYDIHTEILTLDGESSRANLIAEIGNGKPVVGVSGHMDVVTTGDSDKWNYDPFNRPASLISIKIIANATSPDFISAEPRPCNLP